MALLVRSDDPRRTAERLGPIMEALTAAAVPCGVVEFDDEDPDTVRRELRDAAGVLVWADPLTDRGPRSALDALLARLAGEGAWVSAHPEVIDKIGTKDVLVTTAHLSWGSDAQAYPTPRDFRDQFPDRLRQAGTRVVKADRGNGGRTVWKVTLLEQPSGRIAASASQTEVMVQHARQRDDAHTMTTLEEFMAGCTALYSAWGGTGHLIDQEYQPRISEGLVRCYMVQSTVVGCALQDPPQAQAPGRGAARAAVLGVPSPKTMVPPDHPEFQHLSRRLADEWIPAMCRALALDPTDLPMLWDIDLIRGVPAASDPQPYVLCEINASSVIPYPPAAPTALATAVRGRLR